MTRSTVDVDPPRRPTRRRKRGRRGHIIRCEAGCSSPALVYDIPCRKRLCWLHFLLEHPTIDNPKPHGEAAATVYTLLSNRRWTRKLHR